MGADVPSPALARMYETDVEQAARLACFLFQARNGLPETGTTMNSFNRYNLAIRFQYKYDFEVIKPAKDLIRMLEN